MAQLMKILGIIITDYNLLSFIATTILAIYSIYLAKKYDKKSSQSHDEMHTTLKAVYDNVINVTNDINVNFNNLKEQLLQLEGKADPGIISNLNATLKIASSTTQVALDNYRKVYSEVFNSPTDAPQLFRSST